MLLWKKLREENQKLKRQRFNPCSLGCCSESQRYARSPPAGTQFQSLFSWMLLWKSTPHILNALYPIVSILVLLDVALKDLSEMQIPVLPKGFNPCSLGCCSESLSPVKETNDYPMFQSLFSWMLLWKDNGIGPISKGKMGFQSLFSWMLLWKFYVARNIWII